MNFSDLFKQTDRICEFSPNGKYLANVVQFRLVLREVETLEIINIYNCLDTINFLEWSFDSEFILCSLNKRNIVQVFSIEKPEWKCKIDEGTAGLISVAWSPISRHILTIADYHLRITVWSLTDKSVSYMKYPKAIEKCFEFSSDGKLMLLAERRDCKDFCSIFSCGTWELLKHFELDTDDLNGIHWSPNCTHFVVWESPLEYKVLVYDVEGNCLSKFQPSSWLNVSLGVKCVNWSPLGQLLAIGGFDQKIRFLNNVTYKQITEFEHPSKISSKDFIIYKEVDTRVKLKQTDQLSMDGLSLNETSHQPVNEPAAPSKGISTSPSRYEVFNGTLQIAAIKPDLDKPNPKKGVSLVEFSADSRYMYSKNDSMPNILWIWDLKTFKLINVLIQTMAIKCVSWDPIQERLALCTGNNKLYMWSPQGCISVDAPCESSFLIQSLKWNRDGSSLTLMSKDRFCVTYLQPPNNLE